MPNISEPQVQLQENVSKSSKEILDNPQTNVKKEASDEYAQALANMSALEYKLHEQSQPTTKHIISKKMLVYAILSLIISILTLLAGKILTKNNSHTTDDKTVEQLLQTSKDLQDLQSQ